MSSVTQRGSATIETSSNSSSLTVTCNKPTGVVSGDLLVAIISCIGSGAGSTITGPSGWTKVSTTESAGSLEMQLWAKVAGGSEGASYSWTGSGTSTQRFVATLTAWDGSTVAGSTVSAAFGTNYNFTNNQTSTAAQSTASVTTTHPNGRTFYARTIRVASNTVPTLTESSGTVSPLNSSHGNNSASSGVSYSHIFCADDSDFVGSGSKSGLSTTASTSVTDNCFVTFTIQGVVEGTNDVTLPSMTSSFAATMTTPSGTHDVTLPSMTSDFAAQGAPPSGTVDTALPPMTSSIAATSIGGDVNVTLPPLSSAIAGSVNPIGSMGVQLPSLSPNITVETKPFGEHVIVVEPESRAFLVIDEDPGLLPISRSQVTNL